MASRVLYVDDDETTRSAVAEALRTSGLSPALAADATAALDALDDGIDCVVTDAHLPDGDALGLLSSVRERYPIIPFVVYTGRGSERLASDAFAAGVSDYVPHAAADPDALAARVSDLLSVAGTPGGITQYRQLVEAMGDMVYAIDEGGRFTMVNEAAVELSGYDRETLLGSHVSLLLADEDVERGGDLIRSLVSSKTDAETGTYEMELRTADGDALPVENHVALLPMPDGRYRGSIGVLRDISRRVAQRDALATERDQFAALFENIPDPTIAVEFVDGEPIARSVNPAFERTFGYDADDAVGESLDDLVVPESDLDAAREYNEHIRAGETLHAEVTRETTDGPRVFLLHVVPHEVGERTTRGFAIYTDISAQKDREQELERQNERLDEFASVVSHDLRNPLNVAQGHLELAKETGADRHFERVTEAHERMEELVSGLLRLARQGEQVGDTEPVAVAESVASAWDIAGNSAADLEVVDDLPVALADGGRLSQLLENLFRNAVEHGSTSLRSSSTHEDAVEHGSTSPPSQAREDPIQHGSENGSGAVVTVRVGSLSDGFYVEDDGPGIPAADRDSVFEYGYSRLVGTGGEGSGFGLAIVRDVADAHGWSVRATASDEGGARFEVTGVDLA